VLYVEFIGSASADVADQWTRIQEALGSATTVFALLERRPMRGAAGHRAATAEEGKAAAGQVGGAAAARQAEAGRGGGVAAAGQAGSLSASERPRGALCLDGVSFSYPSRPTVTVLDCVHLSIRPGERVAIVGGSGSGKSTVFALALRFYRACAGSISLDGRPLESIPEQELRRRIAWVPQEPPLFPNATIAENIAYGFEEASPAQIEARPLTPYVRPPAPTTSLPSTLPHRHCCLTRHPPRDNSSTPTTPL
jgi:ABC-type multidrug transport system fused ATPase/permease subunit